MDIYQQTSESERTRWGGDEEDEVRGRPDVDRVATVGGRGEGESSYSGTHVIHRGDRKCCPLYPAEAVAAAQGEPFDSMNLF